jgi:hypothetical protein
MIFRYTHTLSTCSSFAFSFFNLYLDDYLLCKKQQKQQKITTHLLFIVGGRDVEHVSEGAESTEFWSFLGGKAPYPSTSKG